MSLTYVVYSQCQTNVSGRFFKPYGKDVEFDNVPLEKWKLINKDKLDGYWIRRMPSAREDFNAVQVINPLFIRREGVKEIVEFLKTCDPTPFFQEADCNSWKSVSVHKTYINDHCSGGQFTGQGEINQLLEPFDMEFEFDYEGEARYRVNFPKPLPINPLEWQDALVKFMYLEALHKFLIRNMQTKALELGKLFLDTHSLHKPIVPSMFEI